MIGSNKRIAQLAKHAINCFPMNINVRAIYVTQGLLNTAVYRFEDKPCVTACLNAI